MKEKIKVACNYCNSLTNHEVIANHTIYETEGEGEDMQDTGRYSYQIISCMGCEAISFRIEETYRNWLEDAPGTEFGFRILPLKTFDKFYPQRTSEMLQPRSFASIPVQIKAIYREIIDSYNGGLSILCATGLRAIVEGVCNDTSTTGQDLRGRIEGLSKRNMISRTLSNFLQSHRTLGNEAVHGLSAPTKDELKSAIKLIDQLLESVYDTPHYGNSLRMAGKERKLPLQK